MGKGGCCKTSNEHVLASRTLALSLSGFLTFHDLAAMLHEAKRHYHALYESQLLPRLYSAPWWLDAVCGTAGWDVVTAKDPGDSHLYAMPYYKTKVRGLPAIITPPMTQWMDILGQPGHRVGNVASSLIEALPSSSILDISLRPGIDPVLRDASFAVSTQYSYILEHHGAHETLSTGYNEGLKRNLRISASRYSMEEKDDVPALQKLYGLVYKEKNVRPPWWIDVLVPSLVESLRKRQCCKLTFAMRERETIAVSLTAWDDTHDYYLIGGRIAGEDGISAHALLLDTAIADAHRRGHDFDFEGSMVPGIAQFFQTFGASPTSYFRIRKFNGFGLLWSLFR